MNKMKIYLVGDMGPEHYSVKKIFLNMENALAAFQEHRIKMLKETEAVKQYWKDTSGGYHDSKIYDEMINNLRETDPEKIDNYPHGTPFLHERETDD